MSMAGPVIELNISGARGENFLDTVRRLGLGGAPSDATDLQAAYYYALYVQSQLPGGDLADAIAAAEMAQAIAASLTSNVLMFAMTTNIMRALFDNTAVLADGAVLTRIGATTPFDGSIALFRYDSADAASVDNGGTIIVDDEGRRWKKVFHGNTVYVSDFARAAGETDDTEAVQRAVAWFNLVGGGILDFGGKTYTVFSDGVGGILCEITAPKAYLVGGGAKFDIPSGVVITVSLGYFIHLNATTGGCQDCYVGGFETDGPVLDITQTTVKGFEFLHLSGPVRNLTWENCYVKNALAGLIAQNIGMADADRASHILATNIFVEHCWYGFNLQFSGDHSEFHIRTDTVHRSFFSYGVSDLRIWLSSKDHYAADCPITTSTGIACNNIELHYFSGTDSVNCGGAVKVLIGHSGSAASVMKNVKIELMVARAASGNTGGAALMITKVDDAGNSDTVDRGHVLQQLEITGYALGSGSYFGLGATGITQDPNCAWSTGDFFRQWTIRNFSTDGVAGCNISLVKMAPLVDQIVLESVSTPGRSILIAHAGARLPHFGKVRVRNVVCANLDDFDATDGGYPLRRIRGTGVSPDTVHPGWSGPDGPLITNDGQGGNMTWVLPAAARGLDFKFARTAAFTMSVDPNGAETLGAGTAGQLYQMAAAGGRIHPVGEVAGRWETNYATNGGFV